MSTFRLPNLGSWVSLFVRCARAATSWSARAGERSSRRVLAAPPGSGSCPTRPHPRAAGCTRNPSPGQCASSPAPRLHPGRLLPAEQAEIGRSGRPARGVRTLAGPTPPLARVVPRGDCWGMRKNGTGPGRGRRERGAGGQRSRERALSSWQKILIGRNRNKTKRKEEKICPVEPQG